PGVEHVLVLAQRDLVTVLAPSLRCGAGLIAGNVDIALLVIPRRYPMAPPELAADAPVLQVVHPVKIGLVPMARHEADPAALDGLDCRAGERRHAHVPLVGQIRFDQGAAAVAARHGVSMSLDAFEQLMLL